MEREMNLATAPAERFKCPTCRLTVDLIRAGEVTDDAGVAFEVEYGVREGGGAWFPPGAPNKLR